MLAVSVSQPDIAVLAMARRSRFRPCALRMSSRQIAADARTLPLFAWRAPGSFRPDGRMYDTGTIRPRRPCPRDFRETYIRLGWDGIVEHYRANWRCIRRWINECGRDELKKARAGYVREHGRKTLHTAPVGDCTVDRQSRRMRYVLGRTLTDRREK